MPASGLSQPSEGRLSPLTGPDVLLLSAGGEGAVRQQPRREEQDPAAPLPAAATRPRGRADDRQQSDVGAVPSAAFGGNAAVLQSCSM